MADDFNRIQNTEVIPGIISSIASFSVCLTIAFFPHLRCLRYIELVFYVSINDLIASIGISLGKTSDGSAACWFQGLSTNFNYLSAIMWSTVITYQVWLIVCKKDVIKDLTRAHILCWGLPLIVTLLPLTTSIYGNDDADAGWCFIADRKGSPSWSLLFWFILSYYVWVWIAMLFNVFFVCAILYKLYRMKEIPQRVNTTIRKLLLYPIIISLCWAPTTVWDMYTQVNDVDYSTGWTYYDGIATICAISQGFLFTCVFFGFNTTVRTAWRDLFVSLGCVACAAPDTPPTQDDKSVSMVSVSMGDTSSSIVDERSQPSDASSGVHRTTRRTSGFLGGGGGGGAVSWYARPQSIAQLQEQDDFIPDGDARLSQRLSILDFLASDPVAVRTASTANGGVSQRLSFFNNLSRSFNHSKSRKSNVGEGMEGGEHGSNPMVSVEINDFGSVRSGLESAGTGTATMSVRRAAEEGFESDEESGITSITGVGTGAEGRRTSQSSVGTASTAGTFGTQGTAQTAQSRLSVSGLRPSVGIK
jgi:hypothetical protein